MFAHLYRREARPRIPARQAAASLCRLAAALAAAACTLLVLASSMPGWQITLIALGSALVAATAAVLLDRARAGRRGATAATA